MSELRNDANLIIDAAIKAALPDSAVKKALEDFPEVKGKVVLVSIGKAAWQMANACYSQMGSRICGGVVVTKYEHSMGPVGNLQIIEAGHPVPDANSYKGAQAAIDAVSALTADDCVIFLISGGGSALFEKPLIPEADLQKLTSEMLASGASINEMNTIRKRMSAVKGGKFAQICAPAKVFSIVLSDIIGDPLDMIASGPAYPDSSTCEEAKEICRRYNLTLTDQMKKLLDEETPKALDNVTTYVTGSVKQLCIAAEEQARKLGYEPYILTACLSCTARDAGVFLGNIAQHYADLDRSIAVICGGETVVKLTGHGLGGRNQELALAAAPVIAGIKDCAVFSVGSDGTDGPTDAAGGYVDNNTMAVLRKQGIEISDVLKDNDAYHALQKCDGLVMTGPTGTNVNDVTVLLIRKQC